MLKLGECHVAGGGFSPHGGGPPGESLLSRHSGGDLKIGPAALRAPAPREGPPAKWSDPGRPVSAAGAHGHRGTAEVTGAPPRSQGHCADSGPIGG